jgi:hypothetical protein
MRHLRLLTALACTLSMPVVLAQTQAPAQPAKYIPPVRGVATIDVIQLPSKRVGKEMVTVLKIKNTSKGSINLLKADEYWYDKSMKIVSGTPYAHKKAPILPGEVVEITLKSPIPAGVTLYQNQVLFQHANGKVTATKVKAFK